MDLPHTDCGSSVLGLCTEQGHSGSEVLLSLPQSQSLPSTTSVKSFLVHLQRLNRFFRNFSKLRFLRNLGKNISRAFVLLALLSCTVLFGLHFASSQHLLLYFLQWIRTLGLAGGVVYIFATAFSNLVFIPSTMPLPPPKAVPCRLPFPALSANTASLVTLAAGYLFGLWFGFLFAYTGCCLGISSDSFPLPLEWAKPAKQSPSH